MRIHFAGAAYALAAVISFSSPAWTQGIGITVGPILDLRGTASLLPTVKLTRIDIDQEVRDSSGNVLIRVHVHTNDTITTSAALALIPIQGVAYITSSTPDFSNSNLLFTTIYGLDQSPTGPPLHVMGVNALAPEFGILSGETIIGNSGTHYTSTFASTTPIGGLASLLGQGFDLSPFAGADPNSDVYVFRTFVPGADAAPPILLPTNVTVGPGLCVLFPVTLTSPAGPSGVFVTLTSSDPSKVTLGPGNGNSETIFIPAGATVDRRTPLVCGVNFGSTTITATGSGLPSASQTVQVGATLTFYPTSSTMTTAKQNRLTLSLSAPAPVGGVTVNLISDKPGVATVPAVVTIPAGNTTVVVPVTGVAAGSTVIHASAMPNISDTTASVTVQ
jgi:hypothetical protein